MTGVSVRFALLSGPDSLHDARVAVRGYLSEWHLPVAVVDDAVLAVSELATNAMRYADASGQFELVLTCSDAVLRLSVSDGSAVPPLARTATGLDEGGRGLAILAALTDRWGIETHDGGKSVWCEVDLARRAGYADSASV